MLSVKTIPVGDLEANCYLVTNGDKCLIIDPGDDADFITQTIANEKLTPTAIVLTHGHFDHVLGCLELKLNFNVPILLHEKDKKIYTSANQSAKHWLNPEGALSGKNFLKVPPIDQFIKEGDKIKVGNETLTVIETPGHTPGSISLFYSPNLKYQISNLKYLFTGDTLFKDAVGRTDLSYSSPSDLAKSLLKLKAVSCQLPTVVYPGHGESFTSSSD